MPKLIGTASSFPSRPGVRPRGSRRGHFRNEEVRIQLIALPAFSHFFGICLLPSRDIYYKDPQLFGSQTVVDGVGARVIYALSLSMPDLVLGGPVEQIVEKLAKDASLGRADFNIVRAGPSDHAPLSL